MLQIDQWHGCVFDIDQWEGCMLGIDQLQSLKLTIGKTVFIDFVK